MQQGQRIYQAFVDAGLMKMTPSEIEALIINLWIVLTNWTNFLYMSDTLVTITTLKKNGFGKLYGKWFLEGPYLMGKAARLMSNYWSRLDLLIFCQLIVPKR